MNIKKFIIPSLLCGTLFLSGCNGETNKSSTESEASTSISTETSDTTEFSETSKEPGELTLSLDKAEAYLGSSLYINPAFENVEDPKYEFSFSPYSESLLVTKTPEGKYMLSTEGENRGGTYRVSVSSSGKTASADLTLYPDASNMNLPTSTYTDLVPNEDVTYKDLKGNELKTLSFSFSKENSADLGGEYAACAVKLNDEEYDLMVSQYRSAGDEYVLSPRTYDVAFPSISVKPKITADKMTSYAEITFKVDGVDQYLTVKDPNYVAPKTEMASVEVSIPNVDSRFSSDLVAGTAFRVVLNAKDAGGKNLSDFDKEGAVYSLEEVGTDKLTIVQRTDYPHQFDVTALEAGTYNVKATVTIGDNAKEETREFAVSPAESSGFDYSVFDGTFEDDYSYLELSISAATDEIESATFYDESEVTYILSFKSYDEDTCTLTFVVSGYSDDSDPDDAYLSVGDELSFVWDDDEEEFTLTCYYDDDYAQYSYGDKIVLS